LFNPNPEFDVLLGRKLFYFESINFSCDNKLTLGKVIVSSSEWIWFILLYNSVEFKIKIIYLADPVVDLFFYIRWRIHGFTKKHFV
jgi:hypothetical protein